MAKLVKLASKSDELVMSAVCSSLSNLASYPTPPHPCDMASLTVVITALGSRKLACSKEPDGCARCKRENVQCNYSVQKQMGRPRKRPRGEAEAEEPKGNSSDQVQQVHIQEAIPFEALPGLDLDSFNFDFNVDPSLGMDLDLSFLDMDHQNLNFFDLVTTQDFPSSLDISKDVSLPQPYFPATNANNLAVDYSSYDKPTGWHTGSPGSMDINFDPGPPAPPRTQAPEFSPETVAAYISSTSPEALNNAPSLSPDSSGSSTAEAQDSDLEACLVPDTVPTRAFGECECLSKLYLVLDALQHLPSDFDTAIRVTRNAAKTAYLAVMCPVCGDPPIDIHFLKNGDAWLKPYQNMMMLGALLPSLSNAYVRILEMVDIEATRAEAEKRKIPFIFSSYGGFWGRAADEDVECNVAMSVEKEPLEPVAWRMTARALLRFDVYGFTRTERLHPQSGEQEKPFIQHGLKDIMNMMEEKSKRRHEQVDAMIASGAFTPSDCFGRHTRPSTEEKPQCMVIIDIAKRSMDNLVIP